MGSQSKVALLRRPDKPLGGGTPRLLALCEREGGYLCEAKLKGSRALVTRDGVYSRTGKPLAVPDMLRDGIEEVLSLYGPKEVALDGELVVERAALMSSGRVVPLTAGLYLFDLVVCDGQWLGHIPFEERRDLVFTGTSEWITTPASVTSGFVEFYERQTGISEGVVVKRLSSTLVGGTKRSSINNAWLKCRHDQQVEV